MNRIKEDIFRINGKQIAKLIVKTNIINNMHLTIPLKFISLDQVVLNKNELQDLIDWLISKHDEM